MATNEINLTLKITESGDLKVVGKKAEQAAAGLDKAGKSARTADRNLKGAAKASANSTKNFSKMAQGISGGIVPAYATLAAQVFAVSAAFNFLKDAGSLQLLQTGQVAYAAATGTSLRSLTKDIQRATDAQLGFRDAAQAAAIGTAAGLDPTQITNIAKAAKDASTVLGRDLTDSFNRLVRGITKAEPELLDELGIILRLDTATQRYADSLGVSADDLTAFQRSQAVANDVLAQSEEKYGKVLEVVGGGANQFAQLSTAFEDIVNDLRNFAVTFLTPIATTLSEMPQLIAIAFAPFAAQVIGTALPGLDRLSTALGEMAETAETKSKEAGKSLKENLRSDDRVKESRVLQGALRKEVEMNAKARLEDVKAHKGSLLQKLKDGDQLNNRQLAQIRENISNQARGYNQLNATQKAAVHRTVNEVERANKLGATKIKGIWASTSLYVQTQLKNIGTTANAVFAKMVTFAQAAGAKIALALSAISWVTLIVSLGALALSFFRSGKAAEESGPKYDYLKEKLADLKQETEQFIKVQNILNSEFENGFKTIEAVGKRLANVSSASIGKALNNLANPLSGKDSFTVFIEKFNKDAKLASDELAAIEARLKNVANYREDIIDKSDGRAALGFKIADKVNDLFGGEAFDPVAGVQKEYNEALERSKRTLSEYLKAKGDEKTSTENAVAILLDEKEVIKGITNERFQENKAVQAYLKTLEDLEEGRAVDTANLLTQRDLVISLADQITRLTRIQEENNRLSSSFEQRLFPLTEYDRYIANLDQEIVRTKQLAETQKRGLTDGETARIDDLEKRRILVDKINTAETNAAKDIVRIEKELTKRSIGKTKLVKEELNLKASIEKRLAKENILRTRITAAQSLMVKDAEKLKALQGIARENLNDEQIALLNKHAANQRVLEMSQDELALSEAKTEELKRQLDLAAQIGDAALQSMESGLAREIAKVIKGEEKSLKDAILSIVKSIGEAIADELAKAAARGIMKFFGFKSAAEDMQEKMEAANLDNQNKMRQVNADAAADMEAAMNRAISKVPTATTAPGTPSPTTGIPTTPECITICPETSVSSPLSEKCGCPTGIGEGKPTEERGFFAKIADAFGMGGVYDSIFSKKEPGTQKDPSGSGDVVKDQAEKVKQGAFDPFLDSLGKLFDKDTPFLEGLGDVFSKGLSGFDQVFGNILNGFMQVFGGGGSTSGMGFASTLMSIFGFANGGIAKGGFRSMAYASGGIAKQPTLGLVGEGRYNEAIVPLPDGKSIPVSMGKGAGQQNNVVINVNIDKDGNASQDEASTGSEASKLGQAISVAVQRELLIQKRSGGILNPYGVS